METIELRDYRPSDYHQVDRLWQETGMGGAFRGDDQTVIENTLQAGGKLLVLEDTTAQTVIGTSWLTSDARRIYLHHFGIKPEYQGKGYSKILAVESIRYAKNRGLQIKLEVHEDNKRAAELYKKYGFKYLGDYDVYIIREYSTLSFL